jgi:hypothetical protein
MGIYRFDRIIAVEPAEELEGMTAHIHGDTPAGPFHIPEMGGMRAIMLFGLFQ